MSIKVKLFSVFLASLLTVSCASVSVKEMKTTEVVFTKELADTQNTTIAPKSITQDFDINDPVVNVLATVRWDAKSPNAGIKTIRWEWYTGEELISQVEARFNFYTTPFTILGNMPTRMLGVGEHRVKLFIEKVEFVNKTFVIKG